MVNGPLSHTAHWNKAHFHYEFHYDNKRSPNLHQMFKVDNRLPTQFLPTEPKICQEDLRSSSHFGFGFGFFFSFYHKDIKAKVPITSRDGILPGQLHDTQYYVEQFSCAALPGRWMWWPGTSEGFCAYVRVVCNPWEHHIACARCACPGLP